ncbi:class F sortase [Gordonia sp. FQ]|uniref:class F sortase n=1 Tax=Gordonia sp. FQ TaxID=3446634 RepID=UPI003F8557A2
MSATLRSLLAVLAILATALLAGCGTQSAAPSSQTGAQRSLPPPVVTHTDDASAPVRIAVGGQSAPTRTVDTDADGVLLPPKDIHELGWWIGSARPGSGAGTIVVTGHVDDVDLGTGFAARFATLKPGDPIEVDTADQAVHRYRVTTTEEVSKEGGLPVDRLNRLDGPETLALVTCGGPFVGPPLGYRDNVVVFASPA